MFYRNDYKQLCCDGFKSEPILRTAVSDSPVAVQVSVLAVIQYLRQPGGQIQVIRRGGSILNALQPVAQAVIDVGVLA